MQHKSKKTITLLIVALVLLIPILLVATSCAPIEEDTVIESLIPNVWVFISHLFATLVLLGVAIWLVWKPTKKALEKRHNYIAEEIKTAEDSKKEAVKKLEEANLEKINAHQQASEIIDSAITKSYEIKEKIESEAKSSAQRITMQAENDASKLQEQLKINAHQQALDIAFEAAEALIQKKIDRKTNEKMVDDLISDLEKSNK